MSVRWHWHDWSRWESYDQEFFDRKTKARWTALWQRRECAICGKRQEREP